jgi:serine/threonine protein kinase
MPLTVQNVYGLLLRSRLLPLDEAKALLQRWQKEARTQADDLDRFRRWLVGHHYLTDYQAGLLFKGHAEGFFIGDYKILERLGRGRMAGVYKAIHSTGQVLAVKVLPPSRAKDPYMLGRFQREARLAIRLKHVNVVRTFQMGAADGLHYIVMEYLEGETLEDVLNRRRRLPVVEAVRVVYQALLGLQHIHEQGLIHRDLKPANLMLTPARVPGQPDSTLNSTVKVLDIGLGREFFDENAPVRHEEEQLTGENVLLGTPDYLAPEQARNARAVDIRADIYSLGCVLYHCIAGHPPFPDSNIITQMIRHAQETPKPLKELNAEVPDGLQQIVGWMMAKDAAQRYPTPERAALALQVFLAAGLEKVRQPEEDASMTQFLLWLEGGPNGAQPVAAPPAARSAPPVARPAAPPPPVPPAAKPGGSHSGKTKKHAKRAKKRRSKGSISVGESKKVKPGIPVAGGGFDVELVPAVPAAVAPTPPTAPVKQRGLTRRDLLLLGTGAGSVLVTVGIAGIVASGGITGFLRRLGLLNSVPDEAKKDK